VKRNTTSRGRTLASERKAASPVAAKQTAEAGKPRAELKEAGRKYRMQVIVTDPEGKEVLNLTKLAFEGELQNGGFPTPDSGEALQLLVNAAREWSA
jgi:hypothetical protein